MVNIEEIEIKKIHYMEEYYPRFEISQKHVNMYRQNLEELPPISLSKELILIDGAHRLRAHEIEGKTIINAIIEDIPKERILFEAIERNARHGKQLEDNEKRKLVRDFYERNEFTQQEIAQLFSVKQQRISEWVKDLSDKRKVDRDKDVFDLFLQCYTQTEIADQLDIPQPTISRSIKNIQNTENGKMNIPDSLAVSDVWRFSSCDSRYGMDGYPGRIAGQVLENFLYYFTKEYDIIIDPMAGGGTTVDVCKAMFRRYRAYDINPPKTRPEIKPHDITKGFPEECRNCDAIYLDPPYWHSKPYQDNTVDKLTRQQFVSFIEKLASDSYEIIKKKGIVGFICQDMVKPYPKLYKGDSNAKMLSMIHLAPLFETAGFELEWRIHVPLHLGQYNAMKTAYAKKEKIMLHSVRDLVIWKKY